MIGKINITFFFVNDKQLKGFYLLQITFVFKISFYF